MIRRGRLLIALFATAALVLPGCGEDEPPLPEQSAGVFLKRALSDPPESARADVDFDLAGGTLGLPVGVAGELDGPYTLSPGGTPNFSLDYDLDAAGLGAEGTVTSTGDTLYLVLFGENYRQPLSGEQIRSLKTDPVDLGREATYDGVEEVDGVDTARIDADATVEVPVPISSFGGDASVVVPELKGRVEAWVGVDDGELRRLRLESRGATVSLELSELGERFEFRPPEGGGFRPLSDLVERFGSLL